MEKLTSIFSEYLVWKVGNLGNLPVLVVRKLARTSRIIQNHFALIADQIWPEKAFLWLLHDVIKLLVI